MKRAQYMTQRQIRVWAEVEKKEGRKIPRTHENCQRIFQTITKVPVKNLDGEVVRWETKVRPGPARPGKTAKDRANRK